MTGSSPPSRARARPKPKPGANKTEEAFGDYLEMEFRKGNIAWFVWQRIKLTLGDDCTYLPDFVAVTASGEIVFYEVKGAKLTPKTKKVVPYARDDAKVKIKVAAEMYWWARFIIAFRYKGKWEFTEVKPA